jgi:D-alanyl-D-alanine dipeptidase
MKYIGMGLILCFLLGLAQAAETEEIKIESKRPNDFINVETAIPQMQIDMRYFSAHNFVGRRIRDYEAPVCLLTQPAVQALKSVVDRLLPMGLTLKAYDCYRPQAAVNDFARWAEEINNTTMRTEFYPTVDKRKLFSDGYIDYHSGHSRGSTIDLTIVPIGSAIPEYNKNLAQVSCTAPKSQRFSDNSLDFGTGFDCFSPSAHPDFQGVSPQAKANRLLLQSLMMQAGFKPLSTEWWHFTLLHEPYPNTYFDFPVSN